MQLRAGILGWAISLSVLILLPPAARGGLGPQNVLVVIDDAKPESVAIGQYYVQRRGIPACNVFHVNRPVINNFQDAVNNLATPIKQYLTAQGLTNQIDVIVLTRGIPYRVPGTPSSIASALYSEATDDWTGTCDLGDNALKNPYYAAAQFFDYNILFERTSVPSAHRRIVMMLSGWDVLGAMNNIDSGVDSDETAPSGTIYMISGPQSSGQPRLYPRHPEIPPARAQLASLGVASQHIIVYSESQASLHDKTDVMGYLTGAAKVDVESNTFLPGAFADHLTSFGGDLLHELPNTQMSILDFTDHGAAGSAGTVTEPCNYSQKFTNAVLYPRYAMGFSLGEAVWMSVDQPWQTIFVGDPLAQPWAVKPVVEIHGPADGVTTFNTVSMNLHVFHPRGDAISRIELYVDGKLFQTLGTYGPIAGNRVTLTVDGRQATYTCTGGEMSDFLLRTLRGLIGQPNRARVNLPTALNQIGFLRIEAVTDGSGGNGVAYGISKAQGSGSTLGVAVRADRPTTIGGVNADTNNEVNASKAVGHVYLTVGKPVIDMTYTFNAATLSPGPHELLFVAYQGDAIATQGNASLRINRGLLGDVNLDGQVNFFDIDPFMAVVLGTDTNNLHHQAADMNQDGVANFFDVDPFVALVLH